MTKKLITFRQKEYQQELNQGAKKLETWEKVIEQIEKVIAIPTSKEQYDSMLSRPLEYVMKSIDAEHRPNINIPIKTEKLIELLEIDLSGLKLAINQYNKHNGQLIWENNQVTAFTDKEKFMVYAETETELMKLDKTIKLIEAFKDFMLIENKEFPIHSNQRLHELRQATGNLINWENGELVPNDYWIKQK
jgi:hypothetical protein